MATTHPPKSARNRVVPDPATLELMFYHMKLMREAERRIEHELYRQGKIVGGVYAGQGQEAIGVAPAMQLVEGDVILPSHRAFTSFVIRGMTLREIFCNWLGRANAPTRGRDSGPHVGDMKRGIVALISQLGDTCPVACGVAMAFKRQKSKNVAVVHFGEGTTSRGDVHEAMNLAAVLKLPVLFLCSNNQYAYSTPTERQFAVQRLSVRGAAYGMPGASVDGNDILAVWAATQPALARARAGEGPSFIEFKTFRMTGHSAHDMAEYVPEALQKEWAKKDPITRFERYLLGRRLITPAQIRELEQKIRKELDEAIAFAESSPLPEGADAIKDVYCEPNCNWKNTSIVRGPLSVASDDGPRTTDG